MPAKKPDRSAIIFMIASFKLLKAIALVLIGIGAFHLMNKDLSETLQRWANSIRVDPDNRFLKMALAHTLNVSKEKMEFVGIATFIYAAMFGTEGIGLFLGKRWAEYMTIVTTSLLMPLEIYEICVHVNWIKVLTLIINALAVVYLIVRIRMTSGEDQAEPKTFAPAAMPA